jgi:hypothetical protein
MCRSEIAEANIAERRFAAADQDRCAIEKEAIDKAFAQECRGGFGAALYEEVVDAGEVGDVGG